MRLDKLETNSIPSPSLSASPAKSVKYMIHEATILLIWFLIVVLPDRQSRKCAFCIAICSAFP